eukprot:1326578-Ditylum_brightwellii.AAC.1
MEGTWQGDANDIRENVAIYTSARKKIKLISFFDEVAKASNNEEEDNRLYRMQHDLHDAVKKDHTREHDYIASQVDNLLCNYAKSAYTVILISANTVPAHIWHEWTD